MQEDMHFYGTYAMARAAGILSEHAYQIAYSAQFVDDSKKQDSKTHKDHGLIYGIATAHHDKDCIINSQSNNKEEQRRVWVPFHFIPGGEGTTLEEKLICQKNSKIANEFFKNHIKLALNKKAFGLHLLGIAAHVYADTFSHYGFSGMSSDYNRVDGDSIKAIGVKNKKVAEYIEKKKVKFFANYLPKYIVAGVAEASVNGLGHAGVSTYPDRPFLHWQVEFIKNRPNNGTFSDRPNAETYLEACENLHAYFSEFAQKYYSNSNSKDFSAIKEVVSEIINFEGAKEDRIEKWTDAIKSGKLFTPTNEDKKVSYDSKTWETQKENFHDLRDSSEATKKDVYLFHQAATYHRYYVLKDLLPSHGIVVY